MLRELHALFAQPPLPTSSWLAHRRTRGLELHVPSFWLPAIPMAIFFCKHQVLFGGVFVVIKVTCVPSFWHTASHAVACTQQ